MRSRVAVAVSLLLLAGSLAPLLGGSAVAATTASAAGVAGTQDVAGVADTADVAGATGVTGAAVLAQEQPAANNTVTRIEVHPNGSATWTIRFRTRLDTDEAVAEYEEFQAAFRNNTSRYLDPFRERMTGVVANANGSTDRRMAATGFSAETHIQEVPHRWGVVRYEFTWHGFAAVDGDRVVVGDVFGGGFYIGDGDALKLAAPEGYVVTEAAPEPDELAGGVGVWYGRQDFDDGQPRFVVEPAAVATPVDDTDGTDDGNGGSDGTAGESDGGIADWFAGTGLSVGVAVAALFGLVLAWRRGMLADARDAAVALLASDRLTGSTADDRNSAETAETKESTEKAETTETATETASDGPAAAGGAADDPLVTDEDRVLDLLAERGGRIKQGEVAAALDWSKSKTSRVLSRMADADRIRKYQIGRENVIELPDEE